MIFHRAFFGLEPTAESLLWVFHHALRTGCVEFLLGDVSVIVGIDLRKVHDVRSGICLRQRIAALGRGLYAPLQIPMRNIWFRLRTKLTFLEPLGWTEARQRLQ